MSRRRGDAAIPYEERLSLHARRAQDAARNAKLLAKLALEEGAPQFERPTSQGDAGDERTLRGIPAIGRGVGGAIPGTRPGGRI